MVRTKAESASRKAVAAKAPRKALVPSASAASTSGGASPSSSKVSKYAGGNSFCERPTPEWQKGIDGFLKKMPSSKAQSEEKENVEQTDVDVHAEPCLDNERAAGSSSADTEAGEGSNDADESSAQEMESSSSNDAKINSPIRRNGMVDSDNDD